MKLVSAFLIIFFVTSFIFPFISKAAKYDPEVYRVQKALKARGYEPGPLDGQWGRSTRNAIEQFQRDSGLAITGMLDQLTKSKLGIISSERGIGLTKEPKERRLALVIGNSAYKSDPLTNPVNDANDMARILKELSFDVILKTNANKRGMLSAIDQFGKRLRNAKVGLFFFAGHGLQVKGINYLIPIGAYVTNETDVEIEGLDVRRILGRMEIAANDVNIIFLDACRDNPFKRSFRSTNRGLAKIDAPKGTFIVYATSPGDVATAGEDANRAECIKKGEEAVRLIKEIGIEALFMKIQYPDDDDDRFHWDKGHVVVIEDEKATFLANPVYPGKVGQEYINAKDFDGKLLFQEFIRIAKTKGKGWFTFHMKPLNKRERSEGYVIKVPDENLIVVSVLRAEGLQQ